MQDEWWVESYQLELSPISGHLWFRVHLGAFCRWVWHSLRALVPEDSPTGNTVFVTHPQLLLSAFLSLDPSDWSRLSPPGCTFGYIFFKMTQHQRLSEDILGPSQFWRCRLLLMKPPLFSVTQVSLASLKLCHPNARGYRTSLWRCSLKAPYLVSGKGRKPLPLLPSGEQTSHWYLSS